MNSDRQVSGHVSLFRPRPAEGQWWAIRNPIGLLRIISSIEHECSTEVLGAFWDGHSNGVETSFTGFSKEFEYLWYSNSFKCLDWRLTRFGQVYIERETERLFFIAPQEYPDLTEVIASWVVSEADFKHAYLYHDMGLPGATPLKGSVNAQALLEDPFG